VEKVRGYKKDKKEVIESSKVEKRKRKKIR
jgi:hypothetical protein